MHRQIRHQCARPGHSKIGTLHATAALASWMFRIVRHECVRRARALLRIELRGPRESSGKINGNGDDHHA
jgi:hypothetical protein